MIIKLKILNFEEINEYYYKISNFNTLEHPELDFVLTYKLEEDVN